MKTTTFLPRFHATATRSAAALALGATVAVTGLGVMPAQAAQADIVSTTEYTKDTQRQEFLTLINKYRASKGVKPVRYSDTLSSVAQTESQTMAVKETSVPSSAWVKYAQTSGSNGGRMIGNIGMSSGNSTGMIGGPSVAGMVDTWKLNTASNSVMLDPKIDVVGFGVTDLDGKMTGNSQPWNRVGTMLALDFPAGSEPKDTRTSVPITVPGPYKDVAGNRAFAKEITWAKSQGILPAYSDGTFRPTTKADRGSLAAAAYKLAGSPKYAAPAKSAFKDVKVGSANYKEIHWAKSRGLLNGYSDGTFRPAAAITRDATAALFYRLAGKPAYTAPAKSAFKDVKPGAAFYKEIHWMKSTGISNGWSDGTFRPFTTTNRDTMAAFLYRFDTKF